MMHRYFMEKDDKCSSPPPPTHTKGMFGGNRFTHLVLLLAFVVQERILPFEMVLWGKVKGTLQYREVPLVEILPPPVSAS